MREIYGLLAEAYCEARRILAHVYLERIEQMARPRDYQKRRVYLAEWEVQVQDFRSLAETLEWADRVISSEWWRRNVGREVRFVPPHGNRKKRATCWLGRVCLPNQSWAWSKLVVLHELAHIVAGSWARHGERFTGAMLMLVEEFMGRGRMLRLKRAYDRNGVKYGIV